MMNVTEIEQIADGIVETLEALDEYEAAAEHFRYSAEAPNFAAVGTFWQAANAVMKYDGWWCDAIDGHARTYANTDLAIRVGWRRDVEGSRWHKFDRISYTTTIDFEPRDDDGRSVSLALAERLAALPVFESVDQAHRRRVWGNRR